MKPTAHQSNLMIWAIYSCICFLVNTKTKHCNTFRSLFFHYRALGTLFASLFFLNINSLQDHGFLLMHDKTSNI